MTKQIFLALVAVAGCATDGDPDLGSDVSFATSVNVSVTLKTAVGQQYVTAENAGGGDVHANRPVAQGWETFTLSDLNGGTLESGDLVTLAASDGHFVCAEGGGGGTVNATRTVPQDWETFRVVKVGGSGTIHAGDQLALQTKTKGLFVSALNGGGGDVVADRTQILGWESFVLGTPGGGGGTTTPTRDPTPHHEQLHTTDLDRALEQRR